MICLFGKNYFSQLYDPYSVIHSEDYMLWAKGRNQESNIMAYFDMVKERNYATRLEF